MAGNPLTRETLQPILAPFEVPDGSVSIAVEDPDGRVLASGGTAAAGAASVGVTSEIRDADGVGVVGRVVGRGPAAVIGPVVESLAASLEAIVCVFSGRDPATQRLEAELALGRRIQRSFVPLIPPDIPGYEVASHYEAAHEVGGDFFDVFRLRSRPGRLAIVIADVTGKGVAAALLMAFARPLIHAAVDNAAAPVEALERTNRILVEERRSSLFITALCAIVELRSGILRLANAGHEPPLFVPGDGGPVRWLEGSGPLLGAFGRLELGECRADLAPGDLVLLYTDGVTDARAASGERFGDDRLLDVIARCRGGSAREAVERIAEASRAFQGEMPAADDVTIVAIKRTERARPWRRRESVRAR
jgi:sigma-B regulation protein RsbU (phosphoserine phosphatase)